MIGLPYAIHDYLNHCILGKFKPKFTKFSWVNHTLSKLGFHQLLWVRNINTIWENRSFSKNKKYRRIGHRMGLEDCPIEVLVNHHP